MAKSSGVAATPSPATCSSIGGVHEKSNSAKRQAGKQQLRRLLDKAGAGFSGSADWLATLLLPAQHMLVTRQ
ncbi:MAG: hypothetical protein HZT40_19270 [Candidatus Thiothrix singaporensis]|uniref:Uncharacterized protein n=1 Tax=Candidatus Thiothrix singaporensis TaxID=2799669 RepID=A0A7L6AMF8_9GAMM|nr:MAG: hypothetical protein HZT40_19270 [Candidatus Thiothrix singaporensis]